jgi:NADPH-dependent ferric siderophore reductase
LKAPKKPPRLLSVSGVRHLTPHMIRVTLQGDDIKDMDAGCAGANCKVFLPQHDQTRDGFAEQFNTGPRPDVRTYTVRHIRPELGEMDIDFVDHGDGGPASAWARAARVGSFCGFAGPGPVKVTEFYADHYLVVADMSALPVAAATLEAMPRDAVGDAYFEITHPDDAQIIDAPAGVRQHWLIHPDAHAPSTQLIEKVQSWAWPTGTVQTCIAGESSVIKALRHHITNERGLPKNDCYISGYWKIGLIEDEHQEMKRAQTASA